MELQVWESKAIKGKGGVKRKDIDDMQRPDREGLEVFDSRETMWQQIRCSSIHLPLQCQHLKLCCYWEEYVYVGQTGGVRFTCRCSPDLQFSPGGGDGSPSSAVKAVQTRLSWIWLEAKTRLSV